MTEPTPPATPDVELVQLLDEPAVASAPSADLAPVLDVPVELVVELGRTTMTVAETLRIGPGSVIALDRLAGDPVDLLVNGTRIARGEVVAVDEEFGLRVTEVVTPDRVIRAGHS
jgi:flagellar motor switch protein FliN/FliY